MMDNHRAPPSSRSSSHTTGGAAAHLQQPLLSHPGYHVPPPPRINKNDASSTTPPSSPSSSSTSTPTPHFLTTPYYREWYRSVDRSTRVLPSILKFLFQLFLYTTELTSLVSSLFIGLFVPVFGDGEDGGGDDAHQFLETATTIALFILTGFVSVSVRRANSLHTITTAPPSPPPPLTVISNNNPSSNNNRFSPSSSTNHPHHQYRKPTSAAAAATTRGSCCSTPTTPFLLDFLLTSLTLVKPIRYFNLFSIRRQKLHTIRTMGRQRRNNGTTSNSNNNVVEITEPGLVSLSEITAAEVEDARVVLYATYFQSLPVAILQIIFLFVTHQQFTLCNLQDLSRIGLLLTTIFTAAKASASFESAVSSHESALHFLSFYRTEGANPMRIYPNDLLSIMGSVNLLNHLATIASRTYNTLFFTAISPWLCPIVPLTTYVINLGLTRLIPMLTLPVYENAPFGVSTSASHYADRYINIFSNALTRFNKLHHVEFSVPSCTTMRRRRTFHIYLPLAVLQLFHFVVPVLLVGVIVSSQVGGNAGDGGHDEVVVQSPTATTSNINATLSRCPELSEWYAASPLFRKIGDSLFSSYRSVDDRLGTFRDLFSGTAVIWLLFYVQVLFGIVYAYADLMRRRRDPSTLSSSDNAPYFEDVFPIADATAFYSTLFSRALAGISSSTSAATTTTIKNDLRTLMVLTILRPLDFYCFAALRSNTPEGVMKKARSLTKRLDESDAEINDMVKFLLEKSTNPWIHRVHAALLLTTTTLDDDPRQLQRDARLFVIFFSVFDRKMYLLTSDRIRRIFTVAAAGLPEPVKTVVAEE